MLVLLQYDGHTDTPASLATDCNPMNNVNDVDAQDASMHFVVCAMRGHQIMQACKVDADEYTGTNKI